MATRQRLSRGSTRQVCRGRRPRSGRAASGWHPTFDVPYEEGHALLGRGRCLVTIRASEAAAPLGAARDIFARLAAKPALAETDKLMQKVPST